MTDEARDPVSFHRVQERFKEVLEMPDLDASRTIRSLKENVWQVYGKLTKAYPQFDDAQLAARAIEAVRGAFDNRETGST
ncbi:hypothetical protein LMG27952_06886 [Paraburkholderia hiiakae]|uniref:Uncharacterized protein n=1 Tax=Paraburkholderia hiiakae TaxID=1081782 RepID=A0ABM8P8Y7_9BURK|nr:hypothetical protein [Paraburkholderia hiiakae]CAD6559530.1 hypothetical protein LMG27952_06886 [Paraburkholderia hiiakae]